MPGIDDLSEREREILCLVTKGASNKQIAQELSISTNTVKVHMRNVFSKIEVATRTEAAMYAVSVGLVEPISADGNEGIGGPRGNGEVASVSSKIFELTGRQRWISLILIVVAFIVVGLSALFLFRDQFFPSQVFGEQSPLEDTLRWEINASLPTARSGFAAAAHGGQIYAIAGESDEGVTDVVERYDPSLDQWITLTSKPVPVTDVNAAVIGGKIYVPGGRLKSGELTDVLEVYDPLDDIWELSASLPFPIHAYALVAFEGKLYLFGGSNGTTYLDVVLTYDPAKDEWDEQTPVPTARGYPGAVVSGNKIFVIGGFDGKKALSVNEVYYPERDNVQTDPWSEGTPIPDGRYGMGIVSIADIIYVLGGEGGKDNKIQPLQYSSQEDEWRLFSSSDSETWAFLGLVPIETELFAVGGLLNNNLTERNLSYKAIYTISLPLIR